MEEGKRGPRRRFDKDLTRGSLLGNLWSLSWPMMVTQTITTLGPTIDMIWVGKLGAASMAGVGVSGMVVTLVSSVRTGLQTGTRAIISRSIGAGDKDAANHVANQSVVISILFAIVTAIIGLFLSRQMLQALGLAPDALAEGTAYLRIQLVGMVTMSFQMLSQSLMQASGDSQTPMRISLATRFFHIALAPFLIFGWWIFPRLGVSGAALTGVISQGIAGALGMWMLYSGRTRLRLSMKNFRFDWKMIWRITKIGIPASLTGTERSSANLLVMWFIVPFGTAAIAAHALMERVDNFIRMPAMGLGNAAGVLAGQNLGAKQPERAEKTAWLAVGLFTGVMFAISVIVWFWPESVISVFNTEPELLATAVTFLQIQIIHFLVSGFTLVLMSTLNGVGDTWAPTLNTLVTLWGVQMPLAYLLSRFSTLGVFGVRWAMVIAVVVRAAVYVVYFKMGRWKTKEV
ncbi:MAG: MATE family efflux transporter [Chloroflexi bacterium]|nr:MATE family efflux transporter [Chloroflexota bacterium]